MLDLRCINYYKANKGYCWCLTLKSRYMHVQCHCFNLRLDNNIDLLRYNHMCSTLLLLCKHQFFSRRSFHEFFKGGVQNFHLSGLFFFWVNAVRSLWPCISLWVGQWTFFCLLLLLCRYWARAFYSVGPLKFWLFLFLDLLFFFLWSCYSGSLLVCWTLGLA